MPRAKKSPVHKYFKFNISSKKSICQIEECGTELSGNYAKNLERHIESIHYSLYCNIFSKQLNKRTHEDQNTTTSLQSMKCIDDQTLTKVKVQRNAYYSIIYKNILIVL